ncbi:hypothetical protein MMC24_007191 [Lignoscripta atroalba]|nr:hypothetical protein [Lignoscripta atroalba]
MDAAALGATALLNKDFSSAISHYTRALTQNHQAVDYYIKRSTAYTRLSPPNHSLALSDAEIAVVLAHKRGKRELIAQGQLRRGIALFGLERWADARQCFEWVKKLMPKESSLAIWEKKVEGKMGSLESGDERLKVVVKELPDVDVDRLGKKENKVPEKVGETGKEQVPEKKEGEGNEKSISEEKRPEGVQTPASKIRHEWYQTPDTVVVTLFAKGIPKDKATIDIQAQSIAISFPLPTGSDFEFSLEPLFGKLDHSSSTHKIMSTKVEFILKKGTPGQKWPSLEGTEPIIAPDEDNPKGSEDANIKRAILHPKTTSIPSSGPAYPTSSKTGPKNWDKLAADLTKKPKKTTSNGPEGDNQNPDAEEDDDGTTLIDDDDGDPVNGFFQKLYAGADPDTRRAMMKSYQESNGTALSTNWGEVGKGKVETSPPEGMVARKWGE